jgi:hypothetical protein
VVLLTRREADVTGGRHQSEAGPPKIAPRGGRLQIGTVADFKSECGPASGRKGGRHQIGKGGRLASESAANHAWTSRLTGHFRRFGEARRMHTQSIYSTLSRSMQTREIALNLSSRGQWGPCASNR